LASARVAALTRGPLGIIRRRTAAVADAIFLPAVLTGDFLTTLCAVPGLPTLDRYRFFFATTFFTAGLVVVDLADEDVEGVC
jgi:hypothetical protein